MTDRHRQGYRVPSPELARELQTLIGYKEGSVRFDDEVLQKIKEADPRGWVPFWGRHQEEINRSLHAYQQFQRDEAVANRKPPQRLPSQEDMDAEKALEARVAARKKIEQDAKDLEDLKAARQKRIDEGYGGDPQDT